MIQCTENVSERKIRMYWIRHGKTAGNLEGRYVGTTDEPLCETGVQLIEDYVTEGIYPSVSAVFSSPMKRCQQTAALIYPDQKVKIVEELAETDFGVFEYKNYEELNGDPVYQQWIDSNGTMAIPDGETAEVFAKRVQLGFQKLMEVCQAQNLESVSCVVHGGVIMKLMQMYGLPKKEYYDWQVKNGCGFAAEVEMQDGNFIIRFRDWICP